MIGRVLLLVALGACKRPTEDECRAMLDRYVEMTVDDDPDLQRASDLTRAALREVKKEDTRRGAAYAASLARCTREVSRRELECAMKAPSPGEWEACL